MNIDDYNSLWIDNKEEQQRKWKKQIKGTVFQIYRKYLKEPLPRLLNDK